MQNYPDWTMENFLILLKGATPDQLRSLRDMLGIKEPFGFVTGTNSGIYMDGKWVPESEFNGIHRSVRRDLLLACGERAVFHSGR